MFHHSGSFFLSYIKNVLAFLKHLFQTQLLLCFCESENSFYISDCVHIMKQLDFVCVLEKIV